MNKLLRQGIAIFLILIGLRMLISLLFGGFVIGTIIPGRFTFYYDIWFILGWNISASLQEAVVISGLRFAYIRYRSWRINGMIT